MHTSFLNLWSRKESNTLFGANGTTNEVETLSTVALGRPGWSVTLVLINLTPPPKFPWTWVHLPVFRPAIPEMKLFTILSASFSRLLLPCGLDITVKRPKFQLVTSLLMIICTYIIKNFIYLHRLLNSWVAEISAEISVARRCHCLSRVATHRLAPSPKPESSIGWYMVLTPL